VKKKADVACFHTHTAAASAWSYAGHVEKKAVATPRQAKKNNATTKSKRPQLPSCGNSKTISST
jgi:hypothetical protein